MKAKPLILLAPSEDKAPGGAPGRLRETPAQRWVREALVDLAQTASPAALQKALQVKGLALDRARAEALALGVRVPLLPALARYTGVAFQALDAATLPPAAWGQVHILSSLRGLVRGDELVPPYKLKLSALPGLKAHWRRALPAQLDALPEGPSGSYCRAMQRTCSRAGLAPGTPWRSTKPRAAPWGTSPRSFGAWWPAGS